MKNSKTTCYAFQPRDQIIAKGHGCFHFAKNMSKNIGKNLSSKYRQKILDLAKQSASDALKTAGKRATQKLAELTGDLSGNNLPDKITKETKNSPQHSSNTVESEIENIQFDIEIPTERFISTNIYNT